MDAALQEEIRELRTRFGSPRDPDGRAFAPLADAYRRAGELEEAESLVDEGRERLPDFAPGHLVAGRIFRDRGEDVAAARAFGRVLKLDPENVEALREAAALAEAGGRTSEAIDLYHRLSHLEPDAAGIRERIRELKRSRFEAERTVAGADRERPGEAKGLEAEAATERSGSEAEAPEPEAEELPAEEPVEFPGPETEDREPEAPEPEAPEPGSKAPEPEPVGTGAEGGGGEAGDEVYTRTMAELYARQGLEARAAEIYRRLVERDPDDDRLRARLEELEARAAAEPPETEAGHTRTGEPGTADRAGETPIAVYFRRMLRWPEADDEPGAGTGDAGAATDEIVPIEALAPDPPSEEDDDFRSWLRGMQ